VFLPVDSTDGQARPTQPAEFRDARACRVYSKTAESANGARLSGSPDPLLGPEFPGVRGSFACRSARLSERNCKHPSHRDLTHLFFKRTAACKQTTIPLMG